MCVCVCMYVCVCVCVYFYNVSMYEKSNSLNHWVYVLVYNVHTTEVFCVFDIFEIHGSQKFKSSF